MAKNHETDVSRAIDPRTIKIKGSASGLDPPNVPTESPENNSPAKVQPSGITQPFMLDQAKPLDSDSFPNQPPRGSNQVPATIPNLQHLLKFYRITVSYNVIKKRIVISVPGYCGSPDNADSVALTHIISLATLNGMAIGQTPGYVEVIADRNQVNPVADWIMSKPWDGVDRLSAFYETLIARKDYPEPLKMRLMYLWLISAVAAALKPSGFKCRGSLSLQGRQGLGKTAWVRALVPDDILRESVLKLDHHLDANNKDSIITAISHWIVEIGELDSSFKKDIARLKGFLTNDRDKLRKPYGRTDSEYPRRTVFCATVNDHNFLVDSTGNTRWWTIPVVNINYQHGIDMQQLFAQMAIDYHKGQVWWLTKTEEEALEAENKKHQVISVIYERILELVDLDRVGANDVQTMTANDVLRTIKIDRPTNAQSKECNAALRDLLGEPKRVKGLNKWRVPMKANRLSGLLQMPDDDDLY